MEVFCRAWTAVFCTQKKKALSNFEYAVRNGVCFCLGRVQDVFRHVVYVCESPLKKGLSLYTVDAIDYLSKGVMR